MPTTSTNLRIAVPTRIIVSLAILTFAVAGAWGLFVTRPRVEPSAESAPPTQVLTLTVEPTAVLRQWNGFGTTRAMDSADVPVEITSTVRQRPENIRPGQSVTRGQMLVVLDDADFVRQAQIAASNVADLDARLRQVDVDEQFLKRRLAVEEQDHQITQSELRRVEQLIAQNAAKPRDLEQAQRALYGTQRQLLATQQAIESITHSRRSLQSQREAQQQALAQASRDVERCRILSPIDGVLEVVAVEPGERVAPGQRVARVVNLSRIEVPLQLPAAARGHVLLGDAANLTSGHGDARQWVGRVARISPTDDAQTRTLTVYVEITQDPASPTALAPGQFVEGVIAGQERHLRIIVPRTAVQAGRVLLVHEGVVRSREARIDFAVEGEFPATGLSDRQWATLTPELPAGVVVVIQPSRLLSDGMPVRAVGPGKGAAVGQASPEVAR